MPHVVIKGPVTPEDIWLAFKPLDFREGDLLFKAEMVLLSQDKSEVLVRSLTVERGFRKRFYVRITGREDGITIGLDTIGTPEKSDGVKRLLGLYAWTILQSEPEATIASTNIPEFIKDQTA
jgi:hypothetical protein